MTKHRIFLINNDVRAVYSARFWVAPTAGNVDAAKIGQMVTETVNGQVNTEPGTPIVFVPEEDHSFCYCVDY